MGLLAKARRISKDRLRSEELGDAVWATLSGHEESIGSKRDESKDPSDFDPST